MVAALLAALATAASAQFDAATGEPNGGVSDLLKITSAAPVIVKCYDPTCIRLFVEIRPNGISRVSLAAADVMNGSHLLDTQAFSSTGATCDGHDVGGLPVGVTYSSGEFGWGRGGAPFIATATKPATMMLEFRCDGRLIPGDEIRVQITLFADPDGRGIQLARFVFSGMRLRGPR